MAHASSSFHLHEKIGCPLLHLLNWIFPVLAMRFKCLFSHAHAPVWLVFVYNGSRDRILIFGIPASGCMVPNGIGVSFKIQEDAEQMDHTKCEAGTAIKK
jgi:hypothetical protein